MQPNDLESALIRLVVLSKFDLEAFSSLSRYIGLGLLVYATPACSLES